MNPKMVGEDDKVFRMYDGTSEFSVPKAGLSPELVSKIRGLASFEPSVAEFSGTGGGSGAPVASGAMGGSGQPMPPPEAAPVEVAPAPAYAYAGNAPTSSGAGGGPGVASPQTVFDHTRGGNVLDHGQGAQSGGDAPKPVYESSRVADIKDLPASFRPRGEASPVVAPAVAPTQPAAPMMGGMGVGGGGRPGLRDQLGGLEAQKGAAVMAANAAAEEGRQKAESVNAYGAKLQELELQRKMREDAANERTVQTMADYKSAQDEMRNINTTVDPGRFWASRSTGGKIAGIIGLALGALGTGPDGINRASQMLNQAIDRDLDAQKAEHTLRIQKGKASVDAAQSAYAMERQRFGDDMAASSAAKASLLGLAENDLKKIAAGAQGPQAQANAQMMLGKIQEEKGLHEQKAADAAATRNHANAAADGSRARPSGGVEGKDARAAATTYTTMAQTIGDLKGLIGDTNIVTEKVGSKAARMQTLAGSLLLQVKDAEKLGALDKGSIQVAEQIIGDPSATFTLDSTKIAKLNALLEQAKRKAQNMGAQ